jgi:type II secretory pathway component PulK
MVLLVVTLLTAMVVSFLDTTQKHLHVTANYKNRLQAFWTAQSGIQLTTQLLAMSAQAKGTHDGIDNACWHCESPCYQELVAPRLMLPLPGSSSFIEPALGGPVGSPQASGQGSVIRCPIVDENRKLSLYFLIGQSGTQTEKTSEDVYARLSFLLQYVLTEDDLKPPEERAQDSATLQPDTGLAPQKISSTEADALAGYVVDWIDTGNNPQGPSNAESAEEGCPADGSPYSAKNGMLDSADEIALVCGFRRMPRNTIQKLLQHLTVYESKTNINTATLAVLHAFCAQADSGGNIQETDSEKIYAYLHPATLDTTPPAIDGSTFDITLSDTVGIGEEVANDLKLSMKTQSNCFRIGFYGLVRDPETGSEDARARIEMVVDQAQGTAQGLRLLYYRED